MTHMTHLASGDAHKNTHREAEAEAETQLAEGATVCCTASGQPKEGGGKRGRHVKAVRAEATI